MMTDSGSLFGISETHHRLSGGLEFSILAHHILPSLSHDENRENEAKDIDKISSETGV